MKKDPWQRKWRTIGRSAQDNRSSPLLIRRVLSARACERERERERERE